MKINFFNAENNNRLFNEIVFDRNTTTQSFSTGTYYFLFEGHLNANAGPTTILNINSNYGPELEDYKDIWVYNTQVNIDLSNGGKLLSLVPDQSSTIKAMTLTDNSVTINTVNNSTIIVCGKGHSFNGGNVSQMPLMSYKTNSGSQIISTNDRCHIVYMEPK